MPVARYCCAAHAAEVSKIVRIGTKRFMGYIAKSVVARVLRVLFRNGRGIAVGAAKPDDLPFELSILRREFLDLKKLVFVDVRKMLPRVAHGPPDFQVLNSRIFAETYVLLKR